MVADHAAEAVLSVGRQASVPPGAAIRCTLTTNSRAIYHESKRQVDQIVPVIPRVPLAKVSITVRRHPSYPVDVLGSISSHHRQPPHKGH